MENAAAQHVFPRRPEGVRGADKLRLYHCSFPLQAFQLPPGPGGIGRHLKGIGIGLFQDFQRLLRKLRQGQNRHEPQLPTQGQHAGQSPQGALLPVFCPQADQIHSRPDHCFQIRPDFPQGNPIYIICRTEMQSGLLHMLSSRLFKE